MSRNTGKDGIEFGGCQETFRAAGYLSYLPEVDTEMHPQQKVDIIHNPFYGHGLGPAYPFFCRLEDQFNPSGQFSF